MTGASCAEDARVEIGLQAAERLAGENVEAHGDERAMSGVEHAMRRRRADQLVAEKAPRIVDAHDLRVLGEGIVDLAIARLDLFPDRFEREKAAARQGVHRRDEVGEAVASR